MNSAPTACYKDAPLGSNETLKLMLCHGALSGAVVECMKHAPYAMSKENKVGAI